MWILVVTILSSSPSVTNIYSFSTPAECIVAGNKAKKDISTALSVDVKVECVTGNRDMYYGQHRDSRQTL